MNSAPSIQHSKHRGLLPVLLAASLVTNGAIAGDVSFRLPLASDSTKHFFVDHDTSSNIKDWACNKDTYNNHHGSDYSRVKDTPIYAAARGKIIEKADGNGDGCLTCTPANGNFVRLEHANGLRTVYLHMEKGSVTKKSINEWVECGEEIGKVGTSGASAGYHLHFEVQRNNSSNYIDPYAGQCSSSYSFWLDQNGASPIPSCDPAASFPKQYRANGSTEIAVGGATGDTHVVFKAKVGTEQLNTAKLQIELRRTNEYGGGFTGQPTHESGYVESGAIAVVDGVYGLVLGDYHWRARVVASLPGQTFVGPWLSFGGNAESAVDFTVAPICQPSSSLFGMTLSSCNPDDPMVTTEPATRLGSTTATVNGTVVARASALQVWFEYGPSLPYQHTTGSASIPANSGPWNVFADLVGLACNTAYHYRLVGSGGGTWAGADLTFRTGSCPSTCTVQLLQPNGGETWQHGEQYAIKWSASGAGCGSSQELGLVRPDGSLMQITPATNGGTFWWTVPSSISPGSGYRILAFDATSLTGDRSDGTFTIVDNPSPTCAMQVNYPNGGETLYSGQLVTIRWSRSGSACGTAQTVVLKDVGGQLAWILSSSATGDQYQWLVPTWVATASGYRMRIWDDSSFTADESDGTFTVILDTENPVIEIRSPSTANEFQLSTDSIALAGIASDNVRLVSVWWSDSRGGGGTGSGTNSWTIGPIFVPMGRTTIWVYAQDGSGNLMSDSLEVVRSLAPPTDLVATAVGTSEVRLAWAAVEGAGAYQIFRGSQGVFDQYDVVADTTYDDRGVLPNTGYVYAVRSITPDGQQFSQLGNRAVATTISFADDPLGVAFSIRAVHHNDLARGANAVRIAVGLPPASFADVSPGEIVRANQLQAIKAAICEALQQHNISCTVSSDPQAGGMIRAVHIRDLRDLIR